MGKVTRRDFIRTTGAIAAGATLCPLAAEPMELKMGGRSVSRTTQRFHRNTYSTCLNCYARCGIIGYSADGSLAKVGGNPNHPNSLGRMCAKGHAAKDILYDPERILQPQMRVGARGEGKWRTITWDEAYQVLVEKLHALWAAKTPEKFFFYSSRDITTQRFTERFVHAFGSPHALVHAGLTNQNKRLAQEMTWGVPVEVADVVNTEYILNFGANPYEAHYLRTSFVQRLTEGRLTKIVKRQVHYGAKLVTFDPRCSQTAGRSDEWLAPFPGTDGLIALAMANVIMKENLHDEAFLRQWTNYPIDKLRQHLARYTPEWAEKESGVSAGDVVRLALEFARSRYATTLSTGGVSKHANGVQNERCVMLLNAVTGRVDALGGFCLPRTYAFSEPKPIPPRPTVKSPFFDSRSGRESTYGVFSEFAKRKDKTPPVAVWFTYMGNPAYECPQTEEVLAFFKDETRLPFHAAIDSHMTETAELADLVLPASTYLERWELESPPSMEMVPFVGLRQPVVQPRGESKPIMDLLIELAEHLGGAMTQYFTFDPEDYLFEQVSEIGALQKAGGLDYLVQKGFWKDLEAKPDYARYKKDGFDTPSGKFEIYSSRLEAMGLNPLPTYEPIDVYRDMKPTHLALITYQWNVHTHYHTANSLKLSELVHRNPIVINRSTGQAMGLQTGDVIEVLSRQGSVQGEVLLLEGIHPKVVAISDNCGHWGYGHVARGKAFKSTNPETVLLWWEKEGNGTHVNPLIAARVDRAGGGVAWQDTAVMVSKIRSKEEPGFVEKYLFFLVD
ncbi:MAG: molybdopterin-dependent oxidoreductase [Nitrospirae bacterium]|nr:molybdopterin-dependent oxidoreductase [Nitrospirota bacterium]